jgi:uncharacterized protein (UPF0147 family)
LTNIKVVLFCKPPRIRLPRVKTVLASIKEDLVKGNQDQAVRVTSAIYTIDEIVNDVNIPMHTKTALWNIVSDLEALKND